jgi:uncharacterized protein with FMN-binding domain
MPYVIAVLVIAVIGIGFTMFQSNKVPATQETAITETATPVEEVANQSATYKDGAHTASATYLTPAKAEYLVEVSLTLANDIVTDAQITYSQGAEKDPNAAKFEAAYRTEVIGKNIDTLNLSRVGGASLTTGAFNNALTNIKTDAKS